MKILVLSDSHSVKLKIDFSSYDKIIHCGDYGVSKEELMRNDVLYVKGNCDSFGPDFRVETLFSRKVFITHGHRENVKFTMNSLYYRALENGCSVCMFGHTHQQTCFLQDGLLFINPGSYPDSYIEIRDEEITLHYEGETKIIQYRW